MNALKKLSSIALVCIGFTLGSRASEAAPAIPTERDRQVIQALLLHLLADPEFAMTRAFTNAAVIVLHVRTPKGTGFLMSQQMHSDIDGQTLPGGAERDLRRRNTLDSAKPDAYDSTSAFYTNLTFASGIVIADLSDIWNKRLSPGAFEDAYPKARGWVEAYLPGYSKDGTRVVVRAGVGPWPHGAMVTAVLEQQGGKWLVKWYKIARYA